MIPIVQIHHCYRIFDSEYDQLAQKGRNRTIFAKITFFPSVCSIHFHGGSILFSNASWNISLFEGLKIHNTQLCFFLIKKAQVLRYHCKILFETNVQRYAHLSYSLQKSKSTYFQEYRGFERRISEINVIIPAQVWSAPKDDAPWKSYPSEYNQGIIIAKNKFFEKIDMQ